MLRHKRLGSHAGMLRVLWRAVILFDNEILAWRYGKNGYVFAMIDNRGHFIHLSQISRIRSESKLFRDDLRAAGWPVPTTDFIRTWSMPRCG